MTLNFAGLEVFITKEGVFPPEDTAIVLLNRKLILPPGQYGLHIPMNKKLKKEVTILSGVIDFT